MGGIWVTRSELIGTTSEIVGYKSGLALSRKELSAYIPSS
jgi:restriction system protein